MRYERVSDDGRVTFHQHQAHPGRWGAMHYSVLPPEINSALIFAGAGSGPMLAAASAWDGLATELASAAVSFGSVTAGLVGGSWQGRSSVAMAAAAAPYAGWLAAAATQAEQAATQAQVMVAEFEAVRLAMVQPALVAANRSGLISLVISNLFGQNAPAIAAAEAAYEEMWALDVSAMAAYHSGASAVAVALPAFALPLRLPAGLAAGPAAVVTALTTAVGMPTFAGRAIAASLGLANVGGGNLGNANNGLGNIGNANLGNNNLGSGNFGSFNIGSANLGGNNIGIGNAGANNFGLANLGNLNTGFANAGIGNFGIANTGNNNIGNGLTGNNQIGIGGLNSGNGNVGLFNAGSANIGFFNSGNGNFGIGNSGNFSTGLFNPGHGNTGFLNAGSFNTGMFDVGNANTGSFNVGHYNFGAFNPGPSNTGTFNTGGANTGWFNTGSINTGAFNIGDMNNGLFNTGDMNNGVFYRGVGQGSLQFAITSPDLTLPSLEIPGLGSRVQPARDNLAVVDDSGGDDAGQRYRGCV